MKVWILTKEVNAYDQYGEYFVAVYFSYPTAEQIQMDTGGIREDELEALFAGENTRLHPTTGPDEWYTLTEHSHSV